METVESSFATTLDNIEQELGQNKGRVVWSIDSSDVSTFIECVSNDTLWSVRVIGGQNGCTVIEIIDPDKLNLEIKGIPDNDNDLSSDYYLGYDKRYAQVYQEGGERFEMTRPNEEILWLQASGFLKSEHVVADLGCGEGRDSLAMADFGCQRVHAVDIAESALGKLKEDKKRLGLSNLNIIQNNLTELQSLDPESIDVAVNMGALHMIVRDSERAAHLQQVNRILKSDGLFLLKHSREWLKGFRTVIWEKIQGTLLQPGQKIPRRIWMEDGTTKEVEMEVLPHKVAEPDVLIAEVEAQGFELIQRVKDTKEGGFGKSYSLLFKKP